MLISALTQFIIPASFSFSFPPRFNIYIFFCKIQRIIRWEIQQKEWRYQGVFEKPDRTVCTTGFDNLGRSFLYYVFICSFALCSRIFSVCFFCLICIFIVSWWISGPAFSDFDCGHYNFKDIINEWASLKLQNRGNNNGVLYSINLK